MMHRLNKSIFIHYKFTIMKVKMKRLGWIIFLSGLCSASALAQKVTIDAEIRPRAEVRDGFSQPLVSGSNIANNRAAGLLLQRSRLGFNYESNSLNARVVLQDARTFGEIDNKGGQLKADTANVFGIYEAWAELLLLPGTSFKIGRQGIQFEDGRLFSLCTWSNTGTAHDLAQLKYSTSGLDAQLGFAYNNKAAYNYDSVYNLSKMYKQLTFLHITKSIVNGLDLSLLGVDEGFQENSAKTASTSSSKTDLNLYHRYTTGGNLSLKNDSLPLSFLLTGYYQFGKNSSTINLNAYLLALKATYNITRKIGVTAGTDYYSGSKVTMDATKNMNTFQKLPYSANHSFNGYMEYWATLPKGGLINYYGGVSCNLNDKLSADATYYTFFLAKDMQVKDKATNKTVGVENNLGSELDLVLNYKLSAETALQLGWCTYFVTDGTKLASKIQNTAAELKMPQYAYLMLTIKPKLFAQK